MTGRGSPGTGRLIPTPRRGGMARFATRRSNRPSKRSRAAPEDRMDHWISGNDNDSKKEEIHVDK